MGILSSKHNINQDNSEENDMIEKNYLIQENGILKKRIEQLENDLKWNIETTIENFLEEYHIDFIKNSLERQLLDKFALFLKNKSTCVNSI